MCIDRLVYSHIGKGINTRSYIQMYIHIYVYVCLYVHADKMYTCMCVFLFRYTDVNVDVYIYIYTVYVVYVSPGQRSQPNAGEPGCMIAGPRQDAPSVRGGLRAQASTSTSQCTSMKGLIVSISWYLGYLKV